MVEVEDEGVDSLSLELSDSILPFSWMSSWWIGWLSLIVESLTDTLRTLKADHTWQHSLDLGGCASDPLGCRGLIG